MKVKLIYSPATTSFSIIVFLINFLIKNQFTTFLPSCFFKQFIHLGNAVFEQIIYTFIFFSTNFNVLHSSFKCPLNSLLFLNNSMLINLCSNQNLYDILISNFFSPLIPSIKCIKTLLIRNAIDKKETLFVYYVILSHRFELLLA